MPRGGLQGRRLSYEENIEAYYYFNMVIRAISTNGRQFVFYGTGL